MGGMQIPFLENFFELPLTPFGYDDQHTLLTLGKHDFIGIHSGFPLRNQIQIDFNARVPTGCGFTGGTGKPGSSHILNTHNQAGNGHHLEAGLKEEFLHKGIPFLHRRPILRTFLG